MSSLRSDAWLAANLPELTAPISKTWKPEERIGINGGIVKRAEPHLGKEVAWNANVNKTKYDSKLKNRSYDSSRNQKKKRHRQKQNKQEGNPAEGLDDDHQRKPRKSPPRPYNPVEDLLFRDIPVKAADDVIFVDDRFSLQSVTDSEASIFDFAQKISAYDTEEFADAVSYKAVAERELRKRVGLILKNEGKALGEMKEMRREDRLANTDLTRASGLLPHTLGSSSVSDPPASKKEWSGVTFAARIARQQAASRQQPAQSPPKENLHSYRTFDPRKDFQVTNRELMS